MATLFVALFLVLFGFHVLLGIAFPLWLTGRLAVIAGVRQVAEHSSIRAERTDHVKSPREYR
jgi:hypothetical protein